MTRTKRFHLVIATDGSRAAKAAVAAAVRFPWPDAARASAAVAKQVRAEYRRSILLAAFDQSAEFVAKNAGRASQALVPPATRAAVSAEVRPLNKERLASARRALDSAARSLTRAGWNVDRVVTKGAPLRDLLSTVAKRRADVAVVGARRVSRHAQRSGQPRPKPEPSLPSRLVVCSLEPRIVSSLGPDMSTPPHEPAPPRRAQLTSRWLPTTGSTTSGFLFGLAVTTLLAGLAWWLIGGSSVRIDTSRPAVVHRIQQLQRLETVVYGMDKIVAGGQESRYLPKLLAGDRLLLIVYGEVTAGVDLGKIDAAQLEVTGRSVLIGMPPAEIFATRIDNERTRVYSRETGLFTRPDPNLESDVRKEAERQIRQAALDGGILQTAATNARATLLTFLQGLGFDRVEVR